MDSVSAQFAQQDVEGEDHQDRKRNGHKQSRHDGDAGDEPGLVDEFAPLERLADGGARHFRAEFEAHVREGRCTVPSPWRAAKTPVGAH